MGLVNGSMGAIHDIAWHKGQDPSSTMLSIMLIKFDEHNGPDFLQCEPENPAFPATRQFEYKGAACSRKHEVLSSQGTFKETISPTPKCGILCLSEYFCIV